MCVICATYWQTFFCIYANRVTDEVANVGFAAYDAEWYAYPLKFQKYNLVMIARSQEIMQFSGLNFMYCTLEYYGKVSILLTVIRINFSCLTFYFHLWISLFFSWCMDLGRTILISEIYQKFDQLHIYVDCGRIWLKSNLEFAFFLSLSIYRFFKEILELRSIL